MDEADGLDYRVLFEGAPDLYLVLDPDLRILTANDAYLEATMTRREEILGRNVFDVFPENPDDPGGTGVTNLAASLRRVRHDRTPDTMAVQKYDVRRRPEEGGGFQMRYWSPVNVPVLDQDGELTYIIHRVKDVTDYVQLNQLDGKQQVTTSELAQRAAAMELELWRRSQELQEVNRDLREANSAKSEFLSRMSHELRTPLTAIQGFAELLQMAEVGVENRRSLDMVLTASEHLLALVDDVLDLSKIETGHVSILRESVSVRLVLESATNLMQPIAAGRDVTIQPPDLLPGSEWVVADRQRLQQVFINLISNGIKYNRAGGEVRLSAQPIGSDRVRIGVNDTGKGLDESSLAKLFVPFERLDAGLTGVEGTGLGLALSRKLVEAMGGRLGVESKPGEGSDFWAELRRSPAAMREAPSSEQGKLFTRRTYEAQRCLLYVEDTVANMQLVEGVLERRPSVRLIPAMLGQLGLDLAREYRPDLILLDVHLPDLDGAEVLRQLGTDPTTRDIPVVVLSADATQHRIDNLMAAGARAYLTKPIGVRRLLEVLDEFIGDDH